MTRRIIEFSLRSSKASKLRDENSEDDKPGEIWSDGNVCMINTGIRVDQYSLNDHDTDQADTGRSGGHV
eukprot:8420883-Karenia_brevis.AAC.1